MLTWIVIGWIICAVISYGWNFAWFQRQFSVIADEQYFRDLLDALVTSVLFGPAALVATIIVCRPFRGFKFK